MTIDIRVNLDRSDNRHIADYYTALIKFNETIHKPDFSAEVNSRYMEFAILKNVDMKKEGYSRPGLFGTKKDTYLLRFINSPAH